MSAAVLVIAEARDGAATALTLEMLGLARHWSSAICALLMADDATVAAELIAHGADRVFVCARESEDYEADAWLASAEKLASDLAPALILAGHTSSGADLAPRLAFRTQRAIATGCVAIEMQDGRVACTRPCYGGNARETLSFAAGRAVATLRSGAGAATRDDSRDGEIVKLEAPNVTPRVRVIARERESSAGTRLEDAKIVVAGGRGLEGPEGFAVLEELASALGAAVGSSRVPCDLGWVPHSKQIGLTGKTVTPDLYFAVGISGAGHHMAGCGNARAIVAINTDPDAAIFREAKLGVVGDYRKVVPALTQAIKERKA